MLALRARTPDLQEGAYRPLEVGAGVLAYRRGETIAVLLNLSAEPQALALPEECRGGEVLLRASSGESGGPVPSRLQGDEGLIMRLPG